MKKDDTYKDKGLRVAVQHKNDTAGKMTLSEDFTDRLMQRLEEPTPTLPKGGRNKSLLYWGRLVGASIAASVVLLLTLHYSEEPTSEYVAADSREGVPAPEKALADSREGIPTPGKAPADLRERVPAPRKAPADSREGVPPPGKALADSREGVPPTVPTDPNLHQASHEQTEDAGYMAPSCVDDFIAKLAEYNHIESEPLNCHVRNDSTVGSTVYVFPDDDRVRLFDRLLQVVCRYDCDSLGYQLTITQQQMMFSLEDRHTGFRYLWLAERISGDRIILYATHAPIGRSVSSECYQNFREKITHTNQSFEL